MPRVPVGWMVVLSIAVLEPARAMVAPANLRGLVALSDVIVYGRVDRWETVEGVRLPVVRVERTLKGPEAKEWTLAVTSTFICDISTAGVGERALFFLQPYRKGPDDMLPVPEPRFVEQVAARGLAPLHRITHFGRGRMPVRVVGGKEHVAVYGDVALPVDLEPSDTRGGAWDRSVPLDAMIEQVRALTTAPPLQ